MLFVTTLRFRFESVRELRAILHLRMRVFEFEDLVSVLLMLLRLRARLRFAESLVLVSGSQMRGSRLMETSISLV